MGIDYMVICISKHLAILHGNQETTYSIDIHDMLQYMELRI